MTAFDQTIPATDGFPLAASVFPGSGNGWAVVNSATGVKRGYYRNYAQYLARQGWTVVTYDYRGIGASLFGRIDGFEARMRDWGQKDFNGVLRWVEDRGPRRLVVVGHSLGGQILTFAERPQRIERFLAVAAQSGYWRHWGFPRKYLLASLWCALMPALARLMGYFPSRRLGLGENLPGGVAREWARWCRQPDYCLGDAPELDFPGLGFRGPLLAYSFSDDFFCPQTAAEAYVAWFSQSTAEHRHLQPSDLRVRRLGHFAFFRAQFEETFWRESAAWLEGEVLTQRRRDAEEEEEKRT